MQGLHEGARVLPAVGDRHVEAKRLLGAVAMDPARLPDAPEAAGLRRRQIAQAKVVNQQIAVVAPQAIANQRRRQRFR